MNIDSNLIVQKIFLEKEKIDSFDKYPFNIDIVKNFDESLFLYHIFWVFDLK